jgi:hypothetical protein
MNSIPEHTHHRFNDDITFEILIDKIHDHKVECNVEINEKLTSFMKGVITWKIATYFFCSAIIVVAGATWAIRDAIQNVKYEIPIEKIANNTSFTADKIKIIEESLRSKSDSVELEMVKKAIKKIKK